MKNADEQLRIRWRRWLGNKTRINRPDWTTLLSANCTGWPRAVLEAHGETYHLEMTRESVKRVYGRAISLATAHDFMKLDAIYAAEKSGW